MIEVEGIKCDNVSCDYEDNTVTLDQYKDYLNKPCPKCGSNLLTEQDMRAVNILVKLANNPIVKLINRIGSLCGSKPKEYDVDMDGSGTYEIKERKK